MLSIKDDIDLLYWFKKYENFALDQSIQYGFYDVIHIFQFSYAVLGS
jgi:hypothetical protein